jgi:hypothetical protein
MWKLQEVKTVALVFPLMELYQHLSDAPDVVQVSHYTEHMLQTHFRAHVLLLGKAVPA